MMKLDTRILEDSGNFTYTFVSDEDSNSLDHYPFSIAALLKTERDVCYGCRDLITDRHLLRVNDRHWHIHCLRCSICQTALDRDSSCYIKDGSVFCKNEEFNKTDCATCGKTIRGEDWVRKARDLIYHVACFYCDTCDKPLSTGEQFGLQGKRLLCKKHFIESIDGNSSDGASIADTVCTDTSSNDGSTQPRAKRPRTCFTEDQIQILQSHFQREINPDSQAMEKIANKAGVHKRVAQVWFQNARARQKKEKGKKKGTKFIRPPSSSSSDGSNSDSQQSYSE